MTAQEVFDKEDREDFRKQLDALRASSPAQPSETVLNLARGIVAAEGFYTQAAVSVAQTLLAIAAAPRAEEPCDLCHGSGLRYIGNSGSESDGNAPEFERCTECTPSPLQVEEGARPATEDDIDFATNQLLEDLAHVTPASDDERVRIRGAFELFARQHASPRAKSAQPEGLRRVVEDNLPYLENLIIETGHESGLLRHHPMPCGASDFCLMRQARKGAEAIRTALAAPRAEERVQEHIAKLQRELQSARTLAWGLESLARRLGWIDGDTRTHYLAIVEGIERLEQHAAGDREDNSQCKRRCDGSTCSGDITTARGASDSKASHCVETSTPEGYLCAGECQNYLNLDAEFTRFQVQSKRDKRDAEQLRKDYEALEGHLLGTGAGSAEEFMLKELACWALIDEVEAYRRGVVITHAEDPIVRLRDKFGGLIERGFAEMTLAEVRKRRITASAKGGSNG